MGLSTKAQPSTMPTGVPNMACSKRRQYSDEQFVN